MSRSIDLNFDLINECPPNSILYVTRFLKSPSEGEVLKAHCYCDCISDDRDGFLGLLGLFKAVRIGNFYPNNVNNIFYPPHLYLHDHAFNPKPIDKEVEDEMRRSGFITLDPELFSSDAMKKLYGVTTEVYRNEDKVPHIRSFVLTRPIQKTVFSPPAEPKLTSKFMVSLTVPSTDRSLVCVWIRTNNAKPGLDGVLDYCPALSVLAGRILRRPCKTERIAMATSVLDMALTST